MTWWTILQIAMGQVLGGVGAAIVLWALLGDRLSGRHRRRRCPRCWFDLSGSSSLTCPECGGTANRERSLFRSRRRWGLALSGIVVLLAGVTLAVRPWSLGAQLFTLLPLRARIEMLGWKALGRDAYLRADLRNADQATAQRALHRAFEVLASGPDPEAAAVAESLLFNPQAQVFIGELPSEVIRRALPNAPVLLLDYLLKRLDTESGPVDGYATELVLAAFNQARASRSSHHLKELKSVARRSAAARFTLLVIATDSTAPFRSEADGALAALCGALPESADEVSELLRRPELSGRSDIVRAVADASDEQLAPLHEAIKAILLEPGSSFHSPVRSAFERYPCGFNSVLADLLMNADAPVIAELVYGLQRRDDKCMAALLPDVRRAALRTDLPASLRRSLVDAHERMRGRTRAPDSPLVLPELVHPAWDTLELPEGHR